MQATWRHDKMAATCRPESGRSPGTELALISDVHLHKSKDKRLGTQCCSILLWEPKMTQNLLQCLAYNFLRAKLHCVWTSSLSSAVEENTACSSIQTSVVCHWVCAQVSTHCSRAIHQPSANVCPHYFLLILSEIHNFSLHHAILTCMYTEHWFLNLSNTNYF